MTWTHTFVLILYALIIYELERIFETKKRWFNIFQTFSCITAPA